MEEFRLLRPKEISCRVDQISEKGLTLLLYVTSRAGQMILDEKFGHLGWKRRHELIGDELYCVISVYNADLGQWIDREDVGKASAYEQAKGRASDSFKRACVNFGIGRELRTSPRIWIGANDVKLSQGKAKLTTYDTFSVKSITYNAANEIDSLEVINQDKKRVFVKHPTALINDVKLKLLDAEIKRTGIDERRLFDMCSIQNLSQMTEEDFSLVYKNLKATPNNRGGKGSPDA